MAEGKFLVTLSGTKKIFPSGISSRFSTSFISFVNFFIFSIDKLR